MGTTNNSQPGGPASSQLGRETASPVELEPHFSGKLPELRQFLDVLAARLVGRRLKSHVRRSDIIQQTLLQAIRAQVDFRGKTVAELREWLATILKHRVVDEARRFKQKHEMSVGVDLEKMSTRNQLAPMSPSSDLIAKEQISLLLQAIEDLPALQKTVVMNRYLDGRSFNEIGEQLAISHDRVRRLWLAALKSLGTKIARG